MVDVEHSRNSQFQATEAKWQSARPNINPSSVVSSRKACFSFAAYARNVIDHVQKCKIPTAKGLTDEEFLHIERTFGFLFPPDLRSILQEGLPVGVGFPNWRSGSEHQLRMMLNLPKIGLLYEIAKGRFWWEQWGSQPAHVEAALQVARRSLKKCPTLVPIYSHCYIPCIPNVAGNPVFFVYEKDIFYCGYDIADFFQREPLIPHNYNINSESSPIDLHDGKELTIAIGSGDEKCHKLGREIVSSFMQQCKESQARRRKREKDENDSQNCNQRLFAEHRNTEALVLGWMLESQGGDDHRESEGKADEADSKKQLLPRKSAAEGSLQPLEKPETLVKSAGNSPRMSHGLISRYTYFHEKPLPAKIITQFTIAAPPWAAKTARHIEFWGDLVERGQPFCSTLHDNLFSAVKVDVDLASLSEKKQPQVGCKDATGANAESIRRCSKRWLGGYFEDMAKRLRKGGWKEDEIAEMIEAVLPAEHDPKAESGQGLLDALALHVEILSASMREAGWSAQDVLEALHWDLSSLKRKRATASKVSPQLSSKIGKISEFVEQK